MHDRLTRSDIEKMEKEIEERKLVKRPELIEAVKEARAQGDLSENFEESEREPDTLSRKYDQDRGHSGRSCR